MKCFLGVCFGMDVNTKFHSSVIWKCEISDFWWQRRIEFYSVVIRCIVGGTTPVAEHNRKNGHGTEGHNGWPSSAGNGGRREEQRHKQSYSHEDDNDYDYEEDIGEEPNCDRRNWGSNQKTDYTVERKYSQNGVGFDETSQSHYRDHQNYSPYQHNDQQYQYHNVPVTTVAADMRGYIAHMPQSAHSHFPQSTYSAPPVTSAQVIYLLHLGCSLQVWEFCVEIRIDISWSQIVD